MAANPADVISTVSFELNGVSKYRICVSKKVCVPTVIAAYVLLR